MKIASLRFLAPRTLLSALRTAAYGILGLVFAGEREYLRPMVEAAVVGGVFADFLTWFFRNLFQMPRHILHGCYDACINVAFGWFLIRHMDTDFGPDVESFAIGFLAFLFVAAVKVAFYTAQELIEPE